MLISQLFQPTPRGVVGLVDDLLLLCAKQGLRLDWDSNQCRIRRLGAESDESINVPLQKSVFRAMLARLAALCNEQNPGSVSPYGGEGELTVSANPSMVLRVAFANTPSEQWGELVPIQKEEAESQVAKSGVAE